MANTIRIPVPGVAYAPVKLPAIDIGDNPYDAVESIVVDVGNALAQRKALEDAARTSEFEADQFRTAASHANARRLNGAATADGTSGFEIAEAGHTQSLNDALEARYEFWASKRPDLRNELRRSFAKMRVDMMPFEISSEAAARAANAVDFAGATMKQLAGIAYLRPADIGAVRDEARNLRAALPEAFAQMFDAREHEINEAYLRGLIRTSPKRALETLKSREDLGIAEPLREALQHEAQRATQAERDAEAAALEHEQIALRLDVDTTLTEAERAGTFPRAAYSTVRDAYKLDPATGKDLEAKLDAAHAHALTRTARHNIVGRALVEGTPLTWDAHHLESLDTHIEAVANGADDEAAANRRRVRMAIIAGTTPPKLQRHIREGLRANDPARRAASIHMLEALETADETLSSWLPTDLRIFTHHFTALRGAGYADTEAFKQLDAAKVVPPEKTETRRHYFDTYVRVDDLTGALGHAFNIEPAAIAEDDMQTLDYRSKRDSAEMRTQEFRPDRDEANWQEVVERTPTGEIVFMSGASPDSDPVNGPAPKFDLGYIVTKPKSGRSGRLVGAGKNLTGDRRNDANCHGFTLADGKFWIEPDQAELILQDEFRSTQEPQPGDIVVYRDAKGFAVHSARVTVVTPVGGGTRIRVIGKRGNYDETGIETDIDEQWPGTGNFARRHRGKRFRMFFYRRR